MKLWSFASLAILCCAEITFAITDPRDITTKPPIHREDVLPWYLHDGDSMPPEEYSGSDRLLDTRNSEQEKSINHMIEAVFGSSSSRHQSESAIADDSSRHKAANKNINYGNKNSLYESIAANSKKPTMVKYVAPLQSSQINTVAKYDERSGAVECPTPEATGEFVYPPDCKYFVNCYHGTAYVQPCAPGTLFNPETLECDFPTKVKCYGNENPYSANSYQRYQGGRQLQRSQLNLQSVPKKPECPPGHNGLLPHPDVCTKFLQCAHGGTFIMDCGPGTAFNPKISVCDWPYNVPACSKDRPRERPGQANPGDNGYGGSSTADHGHGHGPDQYENHGESSGSGRGPYGWNPRPDSVVRPNAGRGYDEAGAYDGRYDREGKGYGRDQRPGRYENEGEMFDIRHGTGAGRGKPNLNGAGQQAGTVPSTGGRYGPPGPSDGRYSGPAAVDGRGQRQYENHGDNPWNTDGYLTRGNANNQRSEDGHSNQWNDDGYVTRGNANNQRGKDQQFGYDPTTQWQWRPDYGQTQHAGSVEPTGESSFNRGHYVDRPNEHVGSGPWNNPGHFGHSESDEQGMSQVPSTKGVDEEDWQGYHRNHGHHDGNHGQHNHQDPYAHDPYYGGGGWQERSDAKYPGNERTDYGRANPDFSNPRQDGSFRPRARPYGGWKPQAGNPDPGSSHNDHYPPRPGWDQEVVPNYGHGGMRPSQPEPTGSQSGVFVPSSWRGHGHQGPSSDSNVSPSISLTPPFAPNGPSSTSNVPGQVGWNQGSHDAPRDENLDDWLSRTNVIQQGEKRPDHDDKMDAWSSKTNIFNAQQGNNRQGVKTSSKIPQNTVLSGIYVNANGTRGHYITREIEVNQGHSNTRTYGQSTTEIPPYPNINYDEDLETSTTRVPETTTIYSERYKPISTNRTKYRWKPMRYKPINVTSDESKPLTNSQPQPNNNPNQPQMIPVSPTGTPAPSFDSFTQRTWNRDSRADSAIELPTATIEESNRVKKNKTKNTGKERETIDFGDVVEPDVDNYDIEVLEKESWKPRLTFQNKTKKSDVESVIMGINDRKNFEVDIFDVELAPWHEDEPPFPVYYIAPVHPLGHPPTPTKMTPATGQILRLRGGSSPRDGYLEVQGIYPGWGIICDSRNGWSLKEAHVVCRQLGYTRGAEMAWQGRIQGEEAEKPWIAATRVDCNGNETRFQSCKFVHGEQCLVKKDAVGIRCMPNRLVHCREDETAHEGQCYHLANPDSGLNHAEALEYCLSRKAQLIDITSQAENNFLSEWLTQKYPNVSSIMTSGVGFTTFNRTLWLWEDSARAKFQFNKWWPGWMNDRKIPPRPGSRPVCVVIKKQFPCHNNDQINCTTDYFFWDVEDCATSMKGHSYICERSYDDIGCVYGKGQMYGGSANVSVSGRKCLPWKDPTLSHALRVNVLNPEVREELMTHNYCRNPNPMKESRPWCYTGVYGEREYCDIPPCGEIGTKRSPSGGSCMPKHFECLPGECIPSPWVCDGEEDCTNGIDEASCSSHLGFFKKVEEHRLNGHDIEEWLNTPPKTCALRCKEADFTCRSFSHKSEGNVCLLSDTNVGMSGDLVFNVEYDYYEMNDRSVNCDGLFVCDNGKCLNRTKICDGKNDCGDRSDEDICTVEKLDYGIRLAGSENAYEGRVEVKVMGHWGQVCDDGFGMNDANVVCKELGFEFGALEISPGGYFGNMDPPDRFMVDQLKCRGDEASLRECEFDGWGVHNCRPEEAVGVICKSAVNSCPLNKWKCDTSPTCIATAFICNGFDNCPDKSDESPIRCMAPFELRLANGSSPSEGRVEVRHYGIWGTVCDDDFKQSAAKVICKSLGYGGEAVAKKNGFFGPGDGPIWLDEVDCQGNESQLYECEHKPWGRHKCDHDEDAGVICSKGSIEDSQLDALTKKTPLRSIEDVLPSDCGRRPEDFSIEDDGIFQRVVRGSIAPKGSYPWQASLRIRGHSRSSHWCGAIVLGPLHVLTAAHCLEGYNKGTYFIRAGDYHSEIDEGTEVEANIEDYYVHEDFGKGGQRMNNDIALVLLKGRGIPLGGQIMPICLPPANTEYSPGLNCTISGFGSIGMGQSAQSLSLRYGWVPLLDQSICAADYVYGPEKITEGMICAGFLDEGVDTCDGDSGGPLACLKNGAFTLYGVTSWGHHCGEPNKPGVYVRVAHYRDWIDKKIRESMFGR